MKDYLILYDIGPTHIFKMKKNQDIGLIVVHFALMHCKGINGFECKVSASMWVCPGIKKTQFLVLHELLQFHPINNNIIKDYQDYHRLSKIFIDYLRLSKINIIRNKRGNKVTLKIDSNLMKYEKFKSNVSSHKREIILRTLVFKFSFLKLISSSIFFSIFISWSSVVIRKIFISKLICFRDVETKLLSFDLDMSA
ncbi:hypothetical protein AGLY_015142 [Aphis glycines]|uniref:Uncharacterized protein n=1 Tax=Aphis glycines TaxID=307491 RepID=A0A6G0T3C3_APHGL|nr:hypothetical protein AGLY_015142 [Aphis glycines]